MTQAFDTVFHSGDVVLPGGVTQIDIGVRNGRIAAIGNLGAAPAAERVNLKGLTVLPGVIDSQVHFREPGSEYKEDLESGTRGAVLGGVTSILEMPNTRPSTLTPEALAYKMQRAEGRTWCDYGFFMGAAAENAELLGTLERLPGCVGVKIFMGSSTGSLLVPDDTTLDTVMRHINRRCAVHAEDEPRLLERKHLAEAAAHPRAHPVWRDEEVCLKATQRLIAAARRYHKRVHVLHITTAEEMAFLEHHKDIATVEILPQHLFFSAPECYERLGTYAQMNPPIREQRHQDALWAALRQGLVDVIASDHAPHTHEEKAHVYPASHSGLTGVQTLLPLMLHFVAQGKLSLLHLVDVLSAGPARVYGLARKGRVARGYDADFSIVDLARRETIQNSWIASKVGWTAYDGLSVTGWPVHTVVRGQFAVREGALVGTSPLGTAIEYF
jgi:dihydroorotase